MQNRVLKLGDRSIFLIGYRGTGKSAVAPLVANRLGYDWVDADDEVERRAGRSIAAIFAEEGEPAFRDRESGVVAELVARRRTVVALGGGAVLREENRRLVTSHGDVVWLTATVDSIVKRLAHDESTASRRPKLTAAGERDEVENVLAERIPLYQACATLVVDTEGKTAAQVAEEIVVGLKRIS
jgi:shikimate kinase